MNDSGFDGQRTVVASLVGVVIGTIVIGMLGLTYGGQMKMESDEKSVVAAR